MKKIVPVIAAVAVIGGLATYSIVQSNGNSRIEHYAGEQIETAEQAFNALETNNGKIAKILKSDSLTDSQLEEIHEISYTLESAIDKLISEKAGNKKTLKSVDEAIQAVHYASENHEEESVREWFAKLEPAAGNIKDDSAAEEQADANTYKLVIKDHKFTPTEIRVPAGEKITLIVDNQDSTPEEFESDDFRREKIIAGNTQASIFVGPLKPGKYHFFGEFNLDTANGHLIAE